MNSQPPTLKRPASHDQQYFLDKAANPNACLAPIHGENVLVCGDTSPGMSLPLLRENKELTQYNHLLTYLGDLGERPLFTCRISGMEELRNVRPNSRLEQLRSILPLLPAETFEILGYAKSLIHWREHNRYCGRCGAPTRPKQGGRTLVCDTKDCIAQIFPRVDPAVLVMAIHKNKCLLGRQAVWPAHMYSVIAGFVELGETLEDAALRELHEETSVEAVEPVYQGSSPWPFPSSLMVGFNVQAKTQRIELRDEELEDAAWFSRRNIAHALKTGALRLPRLRTLSFILLETWFDQGDEGRLKEYIPE